MKGIVYHGAKDFRVEEVPDPQIWTPTDALVRVAKTAICGSDLHAWHHVMPLPEGVTFTMGHEFLGIVEDVGPEVRRFRKGDRVLASCTAGCGGCGLCAREVFSGCLETTRAGGRLSNIFGNPLLPGGQSEAVRVPFADANLFAVPESLADEQALFLTDILPTGYMGALFAEIVPGDVVVVIGSGPVGSFAQRCAMLFGPSVVLAVDIDDERLAQAGERGCETLNPEREDLLETVLALSDGRGADGVIEAVGDPALVRQAIEIARPGGCVAAIGVILGESIEIPFLGGMFAKNITLRSGLVNPQVYIPRLLPLVERGKLDPTEIITHRLPLEEGIHGYEIFANHEEKVLKVVLQP